MRGLCFIASHEIFYFFSNFTDFSLFLYFSDTAPVFSLPRYSVSIPDYSSIDSSVIAFYFTDSDYSDFYVDYQPEYDNDAYFYLDTQSRKFIYRSGELMGSNCRLQYLTVCRV